MQAAQLLLNATHLQCEGHNIPVSLAVSGVARALSFRQLRRLDWSDMVG